MRRPQPKPWVRLPQSFLTAALIFTFGGSIISGGVAWGQAHGGAGWANVDLTFFKWCAAATAFLVLVRLFVPIDWIDDDEIQRLEQEEYAESMRTAAGSRFLDFKFRFWTAVVALLLGFRYSGFLRGRSHLNLNAPTANGGSGAAFDGATLGSYHILNRDWTGIELAMIIPLLVFLGAVLYKGFAHITKLNERPR